MTDMNTRLWVGLFVLVVFVAGLAAGVLVKQWLSPGSPPRFGQTSPRGGAPGPMAGRLLERLAADLELTSEQDLGLKAVFEARRLRLREINKEVRDLFKTQQLQTSAEIAAILTPEQMEIFENEIVRVRQRRVPAGRGGFRGRPRRGPGPH